MAQHGYLREYDEGWDRDEDRERGEREWRGRDEAREDRDWRERDRGFMLGDRGRDRDEDYGYRSSGWEESRDWPRSERGMSQYGREHGYGGFQGDYSRGGGEQGGFGGKGDWREGRRSFSAHPDAHYHSWREKQVRAFDRDYEDYCREREQQFHRDFDEWRRQRRANPQPLQPGMTQTGQSGDPTGMEEAASNTAQATPDTEDAMGAATLGTTSSGRNRR